MSSWVSCTSSPHPFPICNPFSLSLHPNQLQNFHKVAMLKLTPDTCLPSTEMFAFDQTSLCTLWFHSTALSIQSSINTYLSFCFLLNLDLANITSHKTSLPWSTGLTSIVFQHSSACSIPLSLGSLLSPQVSSSWFVSGRDLRSQLPSLPWASHGNVLSPSATS